MMRVSCCVPFCKRTIGICKLTGYTNPEWLCEKHYRIVDRSLKDQRKTLRQRNTRRMDVNRFQDTDRRMWAKIKKQAIERAAGI